jgi:hypothetical protein
MAEWVIGVRGRNSKGNRSRWKSKIKMIQASQDGPGQVEVEGDTRKWWLADDAAQGKGCVVFAGVGRVLSVVIVLPCLWGQDRDIERDTVDVGQDWNGER